MGVDLRSITTFSRISLVLMDDAVIKLEHQSTQDRVRRYPYDSIQAVVIWSRPSWIRIIVCAVGLVSPGILLAVLADEFVIFGYVLASIGAVLIFWYFYCKAVTIRIIRGNQNHDLKGIVRLGRLRRFRAKLLSRIQAAQPEDPVVEPPPGTGDLSLPDAITPMQAAQTSDQSPTSLN